MKKSELRQLIREEITNSILVESKDSNFNRNWEKLNKSLHLAIKLAETNGKLINKQYPEGDVPKDIRNTYNHIAEYLEQIYNGYVTGDTHSKKHKIK